MSAIAAALKHMLAAGMPHEQIVAAVAEMEGSLVRPETPDERRKRVSRESSARFRSRARDEKTSPNVTKRHAELVTQSDENTSPVTETRHQTSPLARVEDNPSKISSNISEPKGSSIAKGEKISKGGRLAEDWWPPPECFDYAAEKGFTLLEAQGEFGKFRNHWLGESGQRARKSRWDFAFRKWLDNAADYRARSRERVAFGAQPARGGQGVTDFASVAARRRGFT